jgi:hypothetical protein
MIATVSAVDPSHAAKTGLFHLAAPYCFGRMRLITLLEVGVWGCAALKLLGDAPGHFALGKSFSCYA